MRMSRSIAGLAVACSLVGGSLFGLAGEALCAESLADFDPFVELPLIRQGTTYTCGIAALHSVLRWASYDLDINDEYLMEACGTTTEGGTPGTAIVQYLQETGMFDVSWKEGMTQDEVRSAIDAGGVVMMAIQAWDYELDEDGSVSYFDAEHYLDRWDSGHWVVACGYNDDEVLFMDPSTAGTYTSMPWEDLDARWHDSPNYVDGSQSFQRLERYGITVYRVEGEGYDSQAVYPLL